MSGWFTPKTPAPIVPPNPSDTANRQNEELANQLASGGYNANSIPGSGPAPVGAPRLATLTGLSG